MNKYEELVPENREGKPTDLHFSRLFISNAEAEACFSRAYHRLLNPPVWHALTGWAGAQFVLTDRAGKEQSRLLEEGDLIRIDIPGPGTGVGGGYDWVRAVIKKGEAGAGLSAEWVGIQLRPSAPPVDEGNGSAAHFFKADASSTFIIERENLEVKVAYYGRNEVPNIHTTKILDNIRNAMVAAGAMAGLSEAQWAAFCKGLLTEEIGGKDA